ncbi:hypothetical protein BU15DRAFT_66269 [Melanogaster broomeanus]|nr:hypothetical protein BU15DRAFT_66269 [Melanogaster broomeanus]
MSNSKPKVTKPPTSSNNGKTPKPETIINPVPPADLFPFAQYASVVGVHTGRVHRGSSLDADLDMRRASDRANLIFAFIIIKRLTEATVFTMCTAVATWLVVIMFGGRLWQVLTSFVPAFTLGYPSMALDTPAMINRMTWMRLFAELSPRNALERAMVYPAVGTVLGSWFGAIPIDNSWCGIMIELYIPAGSKVSRFSSLRKNGMFVVQSLLLVNFWIKLGHGVILPSASTAHVPRLDESFLAEPAFYSAAGLVLSANTVRVATLQHEIETVRKDAREACCAYIPFVNASSVLVLTQYLQRVHHPSIAPSILIQPGLTTGVPGVGEGVIGLSQDARLVSSENGTRESR